MIELYEKFYNIVDNLRELNLKFQKEYGQYNYNMSLASIMEEFKTVIISLGRRTGKTQYIIKNKKSNDLIVSTNMILSKEFFGRNSKYNTSIDMLNTENFRKQWNGCLELPKTIWFDSCLPTAENYSSLSRIYSLHNNIPEQIVVFK